MTTSKSLLTLSTIAVASLAGVQAALKDCYMASSNCTGYYYEDIMTAFVDCYNSKGSPMSREEQFYKSMLEKECNSTMWGTLLDEMNMTNSSMSYDMMEMDKNKTVEACDYYQVGTGYQFTQVD